MKVLLQSGFDTISGYGNSAIQLAVNLEASGIDTYIVANGLGFGLPEAFTRLLQKEKPKNFDIYLRFDVAGHLEIPGGIKEITSFKFHKIAYTMWETTQLSEEMLYENCYKDYDFMFVPCDMNINTFKEAFDKPIMLAPLGVDTDYYFPVNREFQGKLRFCMLGKLNYRKGVFIAIEAIKEVIEKGYDVELNLKTNEFSLHPAMNSEWLHINDNYDWMNKDIREFYQNNDIYLAVSRGEGFNQPPLEFGSTGGVIIAHSWGGHESWFNSSYCIPVPYNLVKVSPHIWAGMPQNAQWAEVNSHTLAELIMSVCDNKIILKEKSRNASRFIAQMFNWNIQIKHIVKLLKEIYDGNHSN